MKIYPSPMRRLWNMRPWRRSPLMRSDYRVQFLLRTVAILIVALSVPLSAAFGTAHYTASVARARLLAATGHTVTATLQTDATAPGDPAGIVVDDDTAYAAAAWSFRGLVHTDRISVPANAHRGDRRPLTVKADGTVAPQATLADHALPDAITAACAMFFGVAAVVSALLTLVGLLLDRRCGNTWAREWAALDRPEKRRSQ